MWMSSDNTLNATHLMITGAAKTGKETKAARACTQIGTLFSRETACSCGLTSQRSVTQPQGAPPSLATGGRCCARHAKPARKLTEKMLQSVQDAPRNPENTPFCASSCQDLRKEASKVPGLALKKSHVLSTARLGACNSSAHFLCTCLTLLPPPPPPVGVHGFLGSCE